MEIEAVPKPKIASPSSKSFLLRRNLISGAAVTLGVSALAGGSSAAPLSDALPINMAVGASLSPAEWFPSSPSPRDRLQLIVAVDQSCDQPRLSHFQLRELLVAATTEASWREGRLSMAGFRADAIRTLGFESVSFRSTFTQPEIVRRDLKRQRDAVRIDSLVRHVESARRGRCATDMFETLRAVQQQAAIARGRPALVVFLSNGLVTARGIDFCQAQPHPSLLISNLRRERLIFSLGSSRVIFVGLGRTAEADCVGTRKLNFLYSFWKAYAKAGSFQISFLSDTSALLDHWRSR
jgi:hypothetical protein